MEDRYLNFQIVTISSVTKHTLEVDFYVHTTVYYIYILKHKINIIITFVGE